MGMIKVWHPELSMRGRVYLDILELFSWANFLVTNNLTDTFGNPAWHHFTKNLLITFQGITALAPDPKKPFSVPWREEMAISTMVKRIFCPHICPMLPKSVCLTHFMGSRKHSFGKLGMSLCSLAVHQNHRTYHGLNSVWTPDWRSFTAVHPRAHGTTWRAELLSLYKSAGHIFEDCIFWAKIKSSKFSKPVFHFLWMKTWHWQD